MSLAVSFAGNSLQTANYITADVTGHEDLPNKDAKIYALAHSNKSKIPFVSYPSRVIKVEGTIVSTTGSLTDLDSKIDTFKGYLTGTDQNLDIAYNSSTRRFTATVNALSITRPRGLAYARFQLEFVCTEPFGMDTSTTTALSQAGRTSASYNDAYTFLGTAPLQKLIVTITYTAVTSGTTPSMAFGNAATGQTITISGARAASDVIVIDCDAKTVTINGIAASFTGAFPEFAPGAQTLAYSDYYTSRTFTISAVYTVRYL